MKLELKHLAPYLLYGLRVQYLDLDYETLKQATLTGLTRTDGVETTYDKPEKTGSTECHGDLISWDKRNNVHDLKLKPILRPLIDIIDEIEINGKKFTPADYWDNETKAIEYNKQLNLYAEHSYCDQYLPYFIIQSLIMWHFDVFGLIDKGLAIDINTLEN